MTPYAMTVDPVQRLPSVIWEPTVTIAVLAAVMGLPVLRGRLHSARTHAATQTMATAMMVALMPCIAFVN